MILDWPEFILECDFAHRFAKTQYKDTVFQALPRAYHRHLETSGSLIADQMGVMPATIVGTEGTSYARNHASPLATGEPTDRATAFTPTGVGDTGMATFTMFSPQADILTVE